jgi:hypothetical protein
VGKQPAIQWYTGDWLKDPDVSKCSPATRGVWFDAINAMASSDRSGSLSGTHDQLARICRCTETDMRSAVEELRTTNAATVRERNGVVTLINRRMQGEHLLRLATRKRVQKHRKAGDVTPMKRKRNAPSSSSSSISSSKTPADVGVELSQKDDSKTNADARTFARNWISAECPSFLRSGPAPFERLVIRLGKDEAVRLVRDALAKPDVSNPFTWLEAKLDRQSAAKAATESAAPARLTKARVFDV